MTAVDVDALVDGERRALVSVLDGLDDAGWATPSLCDGWTVREVAVHLVMPYELSVPRFLASVAASRFRFDAMADRWARRDPRAPAEVVDALRRTADAPFRVPGAPPEAPLGHLVVHAEDVYRPLGVDHRVEPRAAVVVLDQLLTPRARRSLAAGLLDGLAFAATDVDWRGGDGPEVTGDVRSLVPTLAGRAGALDDLRGDGVAALRTRFESRAAARR